MNKKETVIFFFLGIFLISVIYAVVNLSMGRTTFFGRATGEGTLSVENSYIFASPLLAKIDGQKVRVTIFALDGQGKGMKGKQVSVECKNPAICQQIRLVVSPIQPQTDMVGQAIFDLSASSVGVAELQAKVDGVPILRTSTINFK